MSETIELRRDVEGREARAAYLAEVFPGAAAVDPRPGAVVGGVTPALERLKSFDPASYGKTRNHLSGGVSRLSPYLRHGLLTLGEARDHAIASVRHPSQVGKFVQELAWRDYFQRVHRRIGDGVWRDVEGWKTGFGAEDYADDLPDDVREARTRIGWIDRLIEELYATGYLHNHARMWLAAYLVHWRHVHWRAGARWFLQHLLDGDEASNNLSWQWVASTFGAKPYVYNLDNVRRNTGQGWRDVVETRESVAQFDFSYEELAARLFPGLDDPSAPMTAPGGIETHAKRHRPLEPAQAALDGPPLVWLTREWLGPKNPARRAHPDSEAVFVFDRGWIEREGISLKVLLFVYEALLERPTTILAAPEVGPALRAHAAARGASGVAMTAANETRAIAAARDVGATLPLEVHAPPSFLREEPALSDKNLKRFSRYWRQVDSLAA